MKKTTYAAAGLALAAGAGGAFAAGIEHAVPSASRILFEEGRYAEFGVSYTDPDQSGDDADLTEAGVPIVFPGSTGDLFDSYENFSLAYKADIGERLSYALIFDQPYGANTDYGQGSFPPGAPPAGFSYDGTTADLDSIQLTAVVAYDVVPEVKVYGGVRAQRIEAEASIPFVGPPTLPGYTVETDKDVGYGWLVGAAYQRPEIALRVALTYYSEIEHDFETTEFGGALGPTETDFTTPQSVSLDFQTGVAPKTLVFGSVRWVDWSEFNISPPLYSSDEVTGRPLVDYTDDWTTYTLGVGRAFTDTLSGSLALSYEPSVDAQLTTLGPYDGRKTATAALSYEVAQTTVSGGVTYGTLGDTSNLFDTDYNDGSVVGVGLRVGYHF